MKIRHLFAVLISSLMLVGMFSISSFAEDGGWANLNRLIERAGDSVTIALDADFTAGSSDGAISIPSGKSITLDLNGHTLDRNLGGSSGAVEHGSVIEVEGTLTIRDSSTDKTGKITGGYAEKGGGIYIGDGGKCTIEGGSIEGNKADNGGGVYIEAGGELAMTGGSITGNEANVSAGGIWCSSGGSYSIGGDPMVFNNTAPQGDNLLLGSSAVIVVTSMLENNARIDLVAQRPNGALTRGYNMSVSVDVFTYDGASGRLEMRADGELYLIQHSDAIIVCDWQALQIEINDAANRDKVIRLAEDITASEGDSCLRLNDRSVIIDLNGCTIDRNLDSAKTDGHVFELLNNSTLTIRDSAGSGQITGGYAAQGGAVYMHEGSTCNVESGMFTGNNASGGGGAFYVKGVLNVSGGTIAGNSAQNGGAVYVEEEGSSTIQDITLVNNKADKDGGAIYDKWEVSLQRLNIKNNIAGNDGGGIYESNGLENKVGSDYQNYSSGKIIDCNIRNNRAGNNGGGIYVVTRFDAGNDVNGMETSNTISGCSITGNSASGSGGGIYSQPSYNEVTDTEIKSNAANKGGGVYLAGINRFELGGSPAISDNTGGNMYLTDGNKMIISGALNPADKIGVTLESGEGVFTSGLSDTAGNSIDSFSSENPLYVVTETDGDKPEAQLLRPGRIDYIVTFKVVSGAWNDGTTGEKTVTKSRYEDEDLALTLKDEDIPAVGEKPGKGYEAGSWDVTPDTEKVISENTTYTYTYKKSTEPKPAPKPTPAKISDTLMAKATAKGKTGLTIAWNKVNGAAGYDIFFATCNHKGDKNVCKKVKTVKGNKTFSWTKTGLKNKQQYKAYVKAYSMKGGKKTYIRTSPMIHVYAGNSTKNYTNAKSVSVNKTAVSLKKGKTFKIQAKVSKINTSKKLMPKSHVATLRYRTANSKVAAVDKTGKITAKGKGACYVYAYAHNGVYKKIKVTVN